LDVAVEEYKALSVDDQVDFKSSAKSFVRTYNFLAAILPYGSQEWEKKAIFLKLLVLKLPSPEGEDLTAGLLESVDLESYRAEAKEQMSLTLANEDGEVEPVPISRGTGIPVPEMEKLSDIIQDFHAVWGGGKIFPPEHEENAAKQIASLPNAVKNDELYQNAMKNSDAQNARVESDRATLDAVLETMGTGIELYRAVHENEAFKSWLLREVFDQTYQARL
jgi:type I restriction enzyme R subunit